MIVEHKDRLARWGTNYIEIILKELDKELEVVHKSDDKQDKLMEDLIAIKTSLGSRMYGGRRSKLKTEKIIAELKAHGQ